MGHLRGYESLSMRKQSYPVSTRWLGAVPGIGPLEIALFTIPFERVARKCKHPLRTVIETERQGFEPWVRFDTYNHLAGGRFRPLSHLSTTINRPQRTCRNIMQNTRVQGIWGKTLALMHVFRIGFA